MSILLALLTIINEPLTDKGVSSLLFYHVEYLKELKSNNTQYENIQLIKVQIEAYDRKMTTVAIKRAESIKVSFLELSIDV